MLDFALQVNMRLLIAGEPLSDRVIHYLWDVFVLLLAVSAWGLPESFYTISWVFILSAWLVHAISWLSTLSKIYLNDSTRHYQYQYQYPYAGWQGHPDGGYRGQPYARPMPLLLTEPIFYTFNPSLSPSVYAPSPTQSLWESSPRLASSPRRSPSPSPYSPQISPSPTYSYQSSLSPTISATDSAKQTSEHVGSPSAISGPALPASDEEGSPISLVRTPSQRSTRGFDWDDLPPLSPMSPALDTPLFSPSLTAKSPAVSEANDAGGLLGALLDSPTGPPAGPDNFFGIPPDLAGLPAGPITEPKPSLPSPRQHKIWETVKPFLPRFQTYSSDCTYIPCPKITFLLDKPRSLTCRICRNTTPLAVPGSTASENCSPDAIPSILPCGHIGGYECMAAWVETNAECPFCRRGMNYPVCWHIIEPRPITHNTVFTLPLTVPEGGSIPDDCKECRGVKEREQTDAGYYRATAEMSEIRRQWLLSKKSEALRDEILEKKAALDTFDKHEICEW